MEIKTLVKELSLISQFKRCLYIEKYLLAKRINFKTHKYMYGKNIEVVKKGEKEDKELLIFVHYDISPETKEGSNDNTASVAVILAISEFLKNFKCYYTTKLVFLDKEEILGALLNKNIGIEDVEKIISNTGSYQYLKNYASKEKIKGIINLELAGIANCIYFANKSGNVLCDKGLLEFLKYIARKKHFNFVELPFLASDMISIHTLGLSGLVLGAIPELEGLQYLDNYLKPDINDFFPVSWKNIHSSKDNYYTIQEKALKMIYEFMVLILRNMHLIEQFKK